MDFSRSPFHFAFLCLFHSLRHSHSQNRKIISPFLLVLFAQQGKKLKSNFLTPQEIA